MFLTKKQRKEFYEDLLDVVCNDPEVEFGFCYYIHWKVLDTPKYEKLHNHAKDKYEYLESFIKGELPELYKIKPKKLYEYIYWFPTTKKGWETRIKKLYNIIQSM